LRGHHLLCLLGYRGMGYSEEYVENMTKVHDRLREHPETMVQLVTGPDDLCAHFPCGKPYHCQDRNVHERDEQIARSLGITVDNALPWRDIEARIARKLVPADIPRLCATCPWLAYGVCESGVLAVNRGEGLRPLPASNQSEN
jgi:uncharacterized protein